LRVNPIEAPAVRWDSATRGSRIPAGKPEDK